MKNKKNSLLFFGDFRSGNEIDANIFGARIKKMIAAHSVAWLNLEGPIIGSGEVPIAKAGPNIFQAKGVLDVLRQVGFGGFSLANNHIMDYGVGGLSDTLSELKGTLSVGAGLTKEDAYCFVSQIINGIKIGFISLAEWGFGASENGGGFAWINNFDVNNLVKKAKSEVDFLVVFAHAGVEEVEYPLPEWRERYRELVDLGVDVVIGHHPHIVQGYEAYKGKEIYYSLGNFYFNYDGKIDVNGVAISLDLEILNGKIVTKSNVYEVKKQNNGVELTSKIRKKLVRQDTMDDHRYLEIINRECLKLWEDRYKKYYMAAIGRPFSLVNWLKCRFIKEYCDDEYVDTLLLLHNIKIESHRWSVERALGLINASKYEK